MPRYPDSPAVGAGLLAAVAESLAMLRRRIADDDPKVALRAASELTKLLSVCARHGIAVEGTGAGLTGSEAGATSPERTPTEPAKPTVPEVDAAKPSVQPAPAVLSGGTGIPACAGKAAHTGMPVPQNRDPLPGRRRTLTSFLDPPAKPKTVRNGDATAARTG
jgi:hypothetical protein